MEEVLDGVFHWKAKHPSIGVGLHEFEDGPVVTEAGDGGLLFAAHLFAHGDPLPSAGKAALHRFAAG